MSETKVPLPPSLRVGPFTVAHNIIRNGEQSRIAWGMLPQEAEAIAALLNRELARLVKAKARRKR